MILGQLAIHIPRHKAASILSYLSDLNCTLKIVKVRKTKLGDFKTDGSKHAITVNNEENKYRFLLTLIHEIAHLKTFVENGNRVKPHGKEWQSNFSLLFGLWRLEEEFADSKQLLSAVLNQKSKPKACAGVDFQLEKALMLFDDSKRILLDEVPIKGSFVFKGKHYRKIEKRRTRALCLNEENNKKYTISLAAKVDVC